MTPTAAFSAILVTFNSSAVIAAALESIPDGNEVIVVDNASSDTSAEIAEEHGATVVRLKANLGFGTACNRGAAIAKNDRLLFLNPDARLDPGALALLSDGFERYPDAAGFNPRLIEADGSQIFATRTILLPRPYLVRPGLPTSDRPVIKLTGAALAIRKDAFDGVGGFDENMFLYYEDDELSARLIKAGHVLYYVHDAIVRHSPGKSSPDTPEMSAFRTYHAMRAKRYAMNKHGRPFFRWVRIVQEAVRSAFNGAGTENGASARARLKALLE
jgi:GT2 family glycosyltransferase